MPATEMAVRVSVSDLPMVKELVLASADLLHALETEHIPCDTAYEMGEHGHPDDMARFQRFKAAVLAFSRTHESHEPA